MNLLDRFKSAEKRKLQAIAEADAVAAQAAARRQAELDAMSLRERTRNARDAAAIVELGDLLLPLVRSLRSVDVDHNDLGWVVRAAFRAADIRAGQCDDTLHIYDRSPTTRLLAEILSSRPYY
ncbi:MAG: hypothetical protein ABJB12_03845 [Pseudomonadota bacterium]